MAPLIGIIIMKTAILALAVLAPAALALDALSMGAQGVNFWRLKQARIAAAKNERRAAAPGPTFVAQTFTQPLDHVVKNSPTWQQRFWVSTRHYNPASAGPVPVFLLDAGEGPGQAEFPNLDTGIIDQLARATGGVGVVLEHRYYGESIPVQNFTTDSMRWLNNEQALADSANFMRNVKFANVTRKLTAPDMPWIYYGGSYPGARSAIMAVKYPDIVYGAIASSGVVEATVDMWQYMDAIRLAANQTCMNTLASTIQTFDTILDKNNTADTQVLKSLFGLEDVVHVDDFATSVSGFTNNWQHKNWNPAVDRGSGAAFDDFCDQLLASSNGSTHASIGGIKISQALVNYGQYITESLNETCPPPNNVDDCFTSYDDSVYQVTDFSQTWRPWNFQTCTQWGFSLTAPPSDSIPRIISRYNSVQYTSKFCPQAFPPSEVYSIPAQPDVTSVNKYGGFSIARDRLAFIDGEKDPWRPVTVHSTYGAHLRKSTTEQPYILIPGGVHHWDENGLANGTGEPTEIKQVHSQEIAFVKQWLSEWKAPLALK